MGPAFKKQEEESFLADDSSLQPPPDIIAYNELRSCADLFRMHRTNILQIQPEFQREIVWTGPAQTRFIDSLIKQLPIPSMCFSLDYKTQRWQVIDGLQRMATIVRFLAGETWKLSKLEDIDPKLAGKPVTSFLDPKSDLHQYYTRIENLSLPVTVLRCDYSKKSHMQYLFTIFHRLNTGGMKLNNQEIRNCIFSGPFNELLNDLNENSDWMKLNRMKSISGYRYSKQELILRVLAFHDRLKKYNGRLAQFLNDYMDDNKNADSTFLSDKRSLFERTARVAYEKIFQGRIPDSLSITILEATLVGTAFNIEYLEKSPAETVRAYYDELLRHEEFSDEKLREGLSGRQRVIGRMTAAQTAMAGQHVGR
jgi:uncharacterized protein with ParB-like and HNH nuclease domain